jgi:hypothetical protein
MSGVEDRRSVRRRLTVVVALLVATLLSLPILHAQETLRPTPADESAAQIPFGWKAIERTVYDAYAAAMVTGRLGQAAGSLKRATYRLKLQSDGSLTGDVLGKMNLTGDPAIIPLGRPSFGMSDVVVDGEQALWGTDSQGLTCLRCPRDAAEMGFRCSQQGVRRGESVEFNFEWLTALATQLELTVPAANLVETQGLLKTGQGNEAEGLVTMTYEAGSRPNCTIRIHPRSDAAAQPFGMDLRQTLSATPTKVLLQSVVSILPTTTAPGVAEVELPPRFTLLRATMGGDERIPVDRTAKKSGPLRIPLGDLVAGQRVELRLVMERPAEWAQPLPVPRVAPLNGILLREELTLQIERPLEVLRVEGPDYELVSMSVEPAREVWTYQGTKPNAALTLIARAPTAEWSADCFVKRRQQGPRTEMVTLIDLKSQRSPLFEFDVDIVKPWKIVSVTAPDAVGNPVPVTFQLLDESDRSARHRILLRTPATPQKGTTITIAVAAQSTVAATASPEPVAIPAGGRVENYLVLNPIEERSLASRIGTPVEVSGLRAGLRTNAFFEPVRLGTSAIHRLTGPKASENRPISTTPEPAVGVRPSTPTPPEPATPLNESLAVAEMKTLIGTSTSPSSHRALFVFDAPVDVSGAVVRFESDWTLIEVVCDGTPVNAVSNERELTFPDLKRGVREIAIRYTTPTSSAGVPRRDHIAWPQLPTRVQSWTWRVESPGERRVTQIDAPGDFASGVQRPGLRERLLAPLGRRTGIPIFNPFHAESWRDLISPVRSIRSDRQSQSEFVAAVGRDYPGSTSIVSWSAQLLTGLNWVLFVGGMLVAVIVRRFKRGTVRFASAISALAATAAWLLPSPFGSMAGSVLCGNVLAYCIPRRLLSLQATRVPRATGSTMARFAGATVVLIACGLSSALFAFVDIQPPAPNVLLLDRDGEPSQITYVSEAVARDIAAWQRDRLGPAFLIRAARYNVAVDDSELASATLEFELIVPRPDLTHSVQLPFEGLTFRGPDAARINGEVTRLVPTADGTGILLALPEPPAEKVGEPAAYRIQLVAGVRIPSGGLRREFAITIPRCSSAVGVVQTSGAAIKDFRSSSRGRTELAADSATSALGATARWQVRWRTGDLTERAETGVTARAESVVTAEPQVLFVQSRLIFETPELADPFASTRLEVTLPPGSLVSSATGSTLVSWRTRSEPDAVRALLDFASPPIVGQSVDLAYELPVESSALIELPPIPLLPPGRLSNHQIAVVATTAFQSELLTRPNLEQGLWAVEPSEASFSLRKDRGLPIPGAAIELERPLPLSLALSRRTTGRIAELEQSLSSVGDSISWTGAARIETSVRPGFLYEFRVDPAIEIKAASVIERDVERLSRFVREGDRLLLVVGDDRLGTKNVRLEGQLRLEAGKIRSVPLFDLLDTNITRREIVVTSSADQLLQIRRSGGTSLLVAQNDTEWEPLTPSSRRVSLPATGADFEMRWINPASPLKLVEFLKLPDDGSFTCSIEWRLESNQPLPATLAIDAPAETRIAESSDFVEENRRPLQRGRARIELQSRTSRPTEARIFLTAPIQSNGNENGLLPRLAGLSVQPVTYLAVPQSLLARCEIPGDFLDQLPLHVPADWLPPFNARSLLVFRLSGSDWRVSTDGQGTIGDATAEILTSESATSIDGETRLIISPSRAGVLKIEAASEGTLQAVRGSSGALLEKDGPDAWKLLLRPSQPVAIVAAWSMPVGSQTSGVGFGLQTPGLNVQIACRATVSSVGTDHWQPEILAPTAGSDIIVAARLESLLSAARNLPIGIRPPVWLRDELLELARVYRSSPRVGPLAVQIEGLLDSWSARMSTMTAPNSIAPDSSRVTRSPEQVLADQMLVAAADPDLVVQVPHNSTTWSMPRRVFNGTFVSAWVIFWAFVVTKGGQWAAQKQWADRLAAHPGALLLGIGLAWWLLLSPSALGALLAMAGAIWETALVITRRRTPPPPSIAAEAS